MSIKIKKRFIGLTCESNENGRFSTQFRLIKSSLEVKSKISFFSERKSYFEEISTACLHTCLGLTIFRITAKLSF